MLFRSIKLLKKTGEQSRIFVRSTGNKCNEKTVLLDPCCKVAVIVGGTEGIGLSTAHQMLCSQANHVVLLGINSEKGINAVTSLNCSFGKNKTTFMKCDITDKSCCDDIMEQIKNKFKNVAMFVNCAGVWDESNWEDQLKTNVYGTINFTLSVLRSFQKSPGVIVNLAGLLGLQCFPFSPIYSAANSAMIRFTENFGHEENYKMTSIRCTVLCTGLTGCTEFLEGVEQRMPCPHMSKGVKNYLGEAHRQSPDAVAKSIMEIIKYGPTGTIWVVESSRLLYIQFPDWRKCGILVSQFT